MKRTPTSLFAESTMKCPKCGYENQPDALACGLCAEVLKGKTTATPAPSTSERGGETSGDEGPNWAAFGAPTGEPFRFESGKMNYVMPKACVCCLGHYQDEMPITASVVKQEGTEQVTYTTTWTFPFCLDCSAHVKGWQNSWGIGLGLAILTFVAVLWLAGPSKMGGVEWAFAIGGSLVALGAGKAIGSAIFPKAGPRCGSTSAAVSCSGPHNGVYRWKFKNAAYGQAFAEMNRF